MSLRYSHTLIPKSKKFLPSPAQVQEFLTAMVRNGVMGGEPATVLRTPSKRTRQFQNPFTGQTEVHQISDVKDIRLTDVAASIKSLPDFRVEVSGMGRPLLRPLPLDFDERYHVGVVCVVHSTFRSTSDLHEESKSDTKLPAFDTLCDCNEDEGLFSNPCTLEVIRVPLAGCARFWIEFQLGNNLIPDLFRTLKQCDLNLLAPFIVENAERAFGIGFVQGCYWG